MTRGGSEAARALRCRTIGRMVSYRFELIFTRPSGIMLISPTSSAHTQNRKSVGAEFARVHRRDGCSLCSFSAFSLIALTNGWSAATRQLRETRSEYARVNACGVSVWLKCSERDTHKRRWLTSWIPRSARLRPRHDRKRWTSQHRHGTGGALERWARVLVGSVSRKLARELCERGARGAHVCGQRSCS